MSNVIFGTREKPIEGAKLPKSFGHWCRVYGLKFDKFSLLASSRKLKFTEGCASDRRCFRALPHLGLLQICDGYMDRWANSVGAEVPLPRTKAGFEAAITVLLENSTKHQVDNKVLIEDAESRLERLEQRVKHLNDRYGWIADWVARYGHDGKWSRRNVNRYRRQLKVEHSSKRYLKRQVASLKASATPSAT